jgi:hypothetical protein
MALNSDERRRVAAISNLNLLPIAHMVDTAPPGHSNRVRAPVAGLDVEALDAEVTAAGGWIERRRAPESASTGRARRVRRQSQHIAVWYVIPDSELSGDGH